MKTLLVEAADKVRLKKVKELYINSFPAKEREPFWYLKRQTKKGRVNIKTIETEDGKFAGELIATFYDDIILIDYFAISPEFRDMGIGSDIIKTIKEQYADMKIVLEIESTREKADNSDQRNRRKKFYMANGLKPMPYHVLLFGVEMEIMTYGGDVSYEEYHALYEMEMGSFISRWVKKTKY